MKAFIKDGYNAIVSLSLQKMLRHVLRLKEIDVSRGASSINDVYRPGKEMNHDKVD